MPVVEATPEAAPTSAITAPIAAQEPAIPAVGVGSDQDRFLAVLTKVKRDAAKENLAAAQAAESAEEPVEELAEPAEAAAEPAEELETPFEDAEAAPAAPVARDLAKIKALLASDPAAAVDALESALGKDALKVLKLDSKQWAAFRHEKKQFRAAHAERESQLQQIHGRLSEMHAGLQPLIAAKEAFDDGDYQKAHELAFGLDVNEFQKRALRQKQGEDPKVAKLEREIAEERRLRTEAAEQKAAAERARAAQEAEVRYIADLAEEVATLDDEQLARAAKVSGFADQILEIQRDHFDPHTKTTLPTVTAAEMALDKFREAYERWTPVFAALDRGESLETESDRAEPVKAASTKAAKGKQVAPAAKPKRSLTQSSASEAAGPGRALTPEQIYEKHLREMQRAANEELARDLG